MSGAYVFTGKDNILQTGVVYVLRVQSTSFSGQIIAQLEDEQINSFPIWRTLYNSYTEFRQDWEPAENVYK